MKTINDTEFIGLAVSKDKTRPRLGAPVRDTRRIVATDGHRMHILENLVEAPQAWLGTNGVFDDFPEYNLVYTEALKESSEAIWIRASEAYEKLKAFQAVAKLAHSKKPFSKKDKREEGIVICDLDSTHINITYESYVLGVTMQSKIGYSQKSNWIKPNKFKININYFLDALQVTHHTPCDIKMQFDSMMILFSDDLSHRKAVVARLR